MISDAPEQHILWTADAIGRRIGRSAAYVRRTLSQMEGTPVQRHGRGNFFAVEDELLAFMSKKGNRGAA